MCVEAGARLSSVGFEMAGGAPDGSVAALALLERPFCRCGLAGPVDAAVGWGRAGSDRADIAPSVAMSFGNASRWTILAAKASSTLLASSPERRFLAFRMAMALCC